MIYGILTAGSKWEKTSIKSMYYKLLKSSFIHKSVNKFLGFQRKRILNKKRKKATFTS